MSTIRTIRKILLYDSMTVSSKPRNEAMNTSSKNLGPRLILAFLLAIAAIVHAEKMYWTDLGTNTIRRADLDGTNIEDVVTGIDLPLGIALDITAGKVYWTDNSNDMIQRANMSDGSNIEDLVNGLNWPYGIALDDVGGKMYWVDRQTRMIQCANLDGTDVENLVTGLNDLIGIALDVTAGKMYWVDDRSDSRDRILRANMSDGSNIENLVTDLMGPFDIALYAAGGKIYWTDSVANKIQRANISDGSNIEDLVTGLNNPYGIALDIAGGKMYWIEGGTKKIQRANLDGTGIEDIVTGLYYPWDIALDISQANAAYVTTTDDIIDDRDGLLSLREAIIAANTTTGDDIISISTGSYILSIAGAGENAAATGDLDITDITGTLTIIGTNADTTIIDADNIDRVFEIRANAAMNISGVTITGGAGNNGSGLRNSSILTINDSKVSGNTGSYGAGIINYGGLLSINRCTISGNTESTSGGGIYNVSGGTLTCTNSTISGNSAYSGGGICNYSNAEMEIINSTISGNLASLGGGIFNSTTALMTIDNCTISNNSATSGGGILRNDGSVDIKNTIVADNTATSSDPDVRGSFTSQGYNLIGIIGSATGFTNGANGDQVGISGSPIDPLLGPLQDNIGSTFTHALLFGSSAVDAGDPDFDPNNFTPLLSIDQRGLNRVVDGDRNGLATVDIGAYEFRMPIYVDDNASLDGDGLSWGTAYKYLQDALNAVVTGDEIWVAEGVYTPDQGEGQTLGDRYAAFQLVSSTRIYGGFAGGETSVKERDWASNETILSGDVGMIGNNSDNSFHVVTGEEIDLTAVIDGFTITGGNANGSHPRNRGGGMYINNYSRPTVTNCTFNGNYGILGGGISNCNHSHPVVTNCTFTGNFADPDGSGGGMWNSDSSNPIVISCTFSGNSAEFEGGGMANWNSCSPIVINCTFSTNSANLGGGMKNYNSSNPTVTNCFFTGNSARNGGGIHNYYHSCTPTVTNCVFSGNSAEFYGGGIFDDYSSSTIANSILWGNAASIDGAQIAVMFSSFPTISYSDVQSGKDEVFVESGSTLNWRLGNIDVDPNLTPDGHLLTDSPCFNAGDPNFIVDPITPNDFDGEGRILDGCVDIGADEFLDTDNDGLPDFWEQMYFGDPQIADSTVDPDGDGLTNLQEYEIYSSDPNATPLNVPGEYVTIQDAIDAASEGDTILVEAGIYTGPGNTNLDFYGKGIILHAPDGLDDTIIDCDGGGRGFHFHSGETAAAAVIGFTITDGRADYGGAIRCENSNPQFRNCLITANTATEQGAGIYGYLSSPVLADCTISYNDPNGIWMDHGNIRIDGPVVITGNDWMGSNLMFYGSGTITLGSGVTLHLTDSQIRCNVTGHGLIEVPLGSETVIEGQSHIELSDPNGGILCEGLLRAKDHAQITKTIVEVTRVSFEGDVDIAHSTIFAEAGNPYGQFFAEDSAIIQNNIIHADGDRYLDLDPAYLQDMIIANNTIYVTISEGVENTRGGLFELRGDPNLMFPIPPDPNIFHYELGDPNLIPVFDTNSWTIEELYLQSGAKVNLTNRFDFGNGGFDEVLYVKQLVLEPDCQLNTAFNCLYFGDLIGDPNCIVNVPMLGFSLNMIEFDSHSEFVSRIVHNNYIDSENRDYDRLHVIHETGKLPDPNGMMKMTSLRDKDPESLTYYQPINARAKGLFAKSSEQRILVWFEYLFNDPGTELVVYLSDVPELLDHDHPERQKHYRKVGTLKCPPPGRPGSPEPPESRRFGTFHQYVDKGTLDFIRGTRIELEFVGSHGDSMYINNWDPQVECSTKGDSVCKDVSGNTAVDSSDFLTVIGECGSTAVLLPDGINTRACLDGPFSQDGYVDAVDVVSWDWITHLLLEGGLTTLCFDIPMTNETGGAVSTETYSQTNPLPLTMGPLLITGKKYSNSAYSYMQDCLYTFDEFPSYQGASSISEGRLNGKLVSDPQGTIYQLNAELGLVSLSEETVIIPPEPNGFHIDMEPRYDQEATVYIGLYGSQEQWFGRPILDVAFDPNFDSNRFVYAVPVIVKPDSGDPNCVYTAAAKLQVNGPGDYTVVKIFDERPDPNDNQYRDALREIEVDREGNVYVINAHELNESDILWRFKPDGSIKRIDLGVPDSDRYIPAPIGMCVSDRTNMLYLASSQDSTPDPNNSQVYGLKLSDLTLDRTITINYMQHITDITEDPITNDLWVSGFNMYNVPSGVPPVTGYPFYEPYLAQIPVDPNIVTAVHLDRSEYDHDLALPLSVIWTDSCGGADLDGNGQVGIGDFSVIADNWLRSDCDSGNNWCDGADLNQENPVDLWDLRIFAEYWLEQNCN